MDWHYLDNAGVPRIGAVEQTFDRGGTDVTYYFRRKPDPNGATPNEREHGRLDVLSGLRVKETAHAVYGHKPGCPLCESNTNRKD